MKIRNAAALAALAALATACAPQAVTPPRPNATAIRSAINTQLAKAASAIAAKDGAAFANMFTEEATWILPNASTFTGRADIQSGATSFFGTFESFVFDEIVIDKLIVVSDSEAVAFSHGTYTLTEPGKAPVNRVNPVADYWKKGADGVWRVAYELNADGPASTAAALKP